MATITEDYVSFETAKLLKQKGFNIQTLCFYREIDNGFDFPDDTFLFDWNGRKDCLSAPTLQMAMKWLREVHNMHIMVNCVGKVNYDPIVQGFDGKDYEIEGVEVSTTKLINDKWMVVRRGFKTNELAVEAAIKYCLENLI